MPAPARRVPLIPATAVLFASLTSVVGCDPPKKAQTREILGKRTTDIRDSNAEVGKGAVVTTPRVAESDPITQAGSVYTYSISKTSEFEIQKAVDLYQATTGEYPKDFKQFMDEVVKPNNLSLPTLPSGLEYGYDPAQHKLVVLKVSAGAAPKAP